MIEAEKLQPGEGASKGSKEKPRIPYQKPRVTTFGSVANLTMGQTGSYKDTFSGSNHGTHNGGRG
jgi:hypothetical protein